MGISTTFMTNNAFAVCLVPVVLGTVSGSIDVIRCCSAVASSAAVAWAVSSASIQWLLLIWATSVSKDSNNKTHQKKGSHRGLLLVCLVVAAFGYARGPDDKEPLNTCGGNCPSNSCSTCYCGTTTDQVSASTYCAKHNWNQAHCECIISHESGGNAHAQLHDSNGSDDVGLFQVNSLNWGQGTCPKGAPCDPSNNTACAWQVYQWGGNTWKLWSTCGACGCCNSS